MKRLMAITVVLVLTSCGDSDKQANTAQDQPLKQSKNSLAFNNAFQSLLTNYYRLKDALVATNDTMASNAARLLIANADSLHLDELKADSSIIETADGYLQSISAEAKALVAETNIEEKRKSFQMISDNMYDLVRSVQYDQQVVYHQFCPMAFNDAGAYWLSNTSEIRNPYFGKKMLTCGEVKDSLDFRIQ